MQFSISANQGDGDENDDYELRKTTSRNENTNKHDLHKINIVNGYA